MESGILLNNTYRILKSIGVGGLGEIYLGYHENLQKYVVIKKVKENCTSLTNNRIEVDILKGLRHTYLPQVYDFIEMDDGIFTVMDYISGYDLKYYIDNGYQFSEEQLLVWLKQLCQVLDYLHTRKRKIIHCDIKPGNIMITEEGNVCLIDFNISLDGENNKDLVGLSSFYASPEQIRKAEHKMRYGSGEQVKMDEKTDIYSLGAVFYYLISGHRPETRSGYVYPLKSMEHPYSEALVNIVDKAMEMEPSRRFKSAAKMLEALEHLERWTTEYQKLWKRGLVMDFSAACLSIILAAGMFLGYRGMRNDEFFEAHDTFTQGVNAWVDDCEQSISDENEAADRAEELLAEGIGILNDSDFKRLLKKNPDEKADILFGVSQAYIYLGEYGEAKGYLKDILEMDVERAEVFRDFSIINAKECNIAKAEDMLQKALKEGLKEEEGYLLKAEIALAEKDYEKVWEYAMQASGSSDISIAEQAAYYIMEAGKEQGNNEESISVLGAVAAKKEGIVRVIWLRKQGEACLQLYEKGKRMQLKEAAACFESIYNSGYAQKVDLYNLAAVYTDLGSYEKSKRLLSEMKKNYPNEYKVPMYLSFVIYRMEGEKSSRDYREVEKYYNEALKICKSQGIDPKADFNMVQLGTIIEQLEEQGWID